MELIRRRKAPDENENPPHEIDDVDDKKTKKKIVVTKQKWSCIDSCCWFVGYISSFPQHVTEAFNGPVADPPVVFIHRIVTCGLELWEGHQCADGLFRKRLWGGTFEVYKRPLCWAKHMSLDNESGLDPPGTRVRPVAADYFAPGYFVWAPDKKQYRTMVATNRGNKAVIVPHSMGAIYFLHFVKWVEAPAPMGGGGGPDRCAKHIKAVMNIGGPLLGVLKALAALFSAEARDIAVARSIAPAVMDKDLFHIQTLPHVMKMLRTWDSIMSMLHDKLSNAPDVEIYSMCGVGIPTERAYVYKQTPIAQCHTPFQIETSAEEGSEGYLKNGVFTVDGDETVPILSAGFMCAFGWRGRTRFNPSGIKTYLREYDHAPPANLLEGRGTQSGNHGDIMGNFALIEDIMRVAAGATGKDLGGDHQVV
ncbi:unnamed protein product [Withania somnifera]